MVRENTWYDFNFLEFLEDCFVSYHVVYLWKCSMCIWKEGVFYFFGMKGSLYISVKSISSRALYNATMSLLISCLEDLSIFDSGVLKSPTILVLLSISFLTSSEILCIWVLPCRVNIYLQCLCLLGVFFFEYYEVTFWVSLYGPSLEVYFVWYDYCYPCFFFLSFCLEYLSPALHFQSVKVFCPEVGLL